jgi:hypothetical protein
MRSGQCAIVAQVAARDTPPGEIKPRSGTPEIGASRMPIFCLS